MVLENTEGTGGLHMRREARTASTYSLMRHSLDGEMDSSRDCALHVVFTSQNLF